MMLLGGLIGAIVVKHLSSVDTDAWWKQTCLVQKRFITAAMNTWKDTCLLNAQYCCSLIIVSSCRITMGTNTKSTPCVYWIFTFTSQSREQDVGKHCLSTCLRWDYQTHYEENTIMTVKKLVYHVQNHPDLHKFKPGFSRPHSLFPDKHYTSVIQIANITIYNCAFVK